MIYITYTEIIWAYIDFSNLEIWNVNKHEQGHLLVRNEINMILM